MPSGYLLGIDIGTRSSKGAIVDQNGNIVATEKAEHGISNPHHGWFEHDAESVWWNDFVKICQALFRKSKIKPESIEAVGCSALTANFLPMDKENRPLRPAILYGIDIRASSEIAEIKKIVGEERIRKISGNRLTAQSVGPKILWLKKNEPEIYGKTKKTVPATSYLVYKLTGEYTIDHYAASTYEPLFNLSGRKWDREVCKEIGISPYLLPDIRSSTDIAGHITASASKVTGLTQGTPVIVGGPDSLMGMVSAGTTQIGQTVLIYGSTMIILHVAARPISDSSLILRPFLVPDRYIVIGAMATSGILIDWFLREVIQSEMKDESQYRMLSKDAGRIPPGSDGLVILPYFSGERTPVWDQKARGLIFGLTLSHTGSHIYRGILEGISYALLHHLECMKNSGYSVRQVAAIGGGTRNTLWTQILSDVTGLDQKCVSQLADAQVGAAYLAGYGAGVFNDFEPLRSEWVKVEGAVKPDNKKWDLYQKYYRIYRELYERTKSQMHRLASIADLKKEV